MIKEKFIPHLATIAMICVVALVGIGAVFNMTAGDEKQDVTAIQQPEYMSKIFDKDQLLQINIQIDESNWEELKENATAEQYYPADITINGETYKNIGIRAKGNSSLSMVAGDETTDRYSFKIDVSEYQEQSIYGLEKFVLNNMIGDATYMKEYLSYDMYKEMGIATPGYAFANITLNGEPWGVYLAVEALEESFVQRNFGDLDGNLYKVESTGNMGGGGKDDKGGMMPEMPSDAAKMPNNNESELNTNEASTTEEKPKAEEMPNNTEKMAPPEEGQTDAANIKQMSTTMMQQAPSEPTGNMQMPPNGAEGNMQMPPNGAPDDMQIPSEQAAADTQVPEQSGEMAENNIPQAEAKAEMVEKLGQNKDKGHMGFPGGMGAGGANLVYTDDEISSYSSIFDYTILKTTTENDYKTLISILKNLNEGTNLEECIDVEEVLKYFAINTFLVNLDSYAGSMKHNFYLYEEDGKLQILPWDYNLAFGAFQMTNASEVINFPIDEPVTDTMENSPLISKLLEVDEYKELYHSYLQELIDTYITSGKYEETITKLDALIGESVKADATAFFTYDEYVAGVKELKQYGTDRTASIKAQLAGEQPSTEYGTIATNINLMAMGQQNVGMGGPGGPGGHGEQDIASDTKNPSEQMPEQNATQEAEQSPAGNMSQGEVAGNPSQGKTQEGQLQGNQPQGGGEGNRMPGGMPGMPNVDMETIGQLMNIVGEISSSSELTEAQKEKIAALGIEDETLESLFTMKNNFMKKGGQHPGMPGTTEEVKMSTEDKVMAAVCSILLITGLIFALKFKRKRY